MEPGNAPHLPDTATTTKVVTPEEKNNRITLTKLPPLAIGLTLVFLLLGFIGIAYFHGLGIMLLYILVNAFIIGFSAAAPSSSFKMKYSYFIGFILIVPTAPTVYTLYRIGGLGMIIAGFISYAVLLYLSTKKQTKKHPKI